MAPDSNRSIDELLSIDAEEEVRAMTVFIRETVDALKKEGAVVGLSGGIDSSVTAALCVKALGKENVLGVILPDRDSSPDSKRLALEHASLLGIEVKEIDITGILETVGTYGLRDETVRSIMGTVPEGSTINLTQPSDLMEKGSMGIYRLSLRTPEGETLDRRLNKQGLRGIISATNTKQRTRMMMLYLMAESRGYMVAGTTNRSEMLMGFFVKYGDGGVDVEPLSHLYKTQVYDLARRLGVPQAIIDRTPSPDTFPEPVSDKDFYFRMDYPILDRVLLSWEKGMEPELTASQLGVPKEQIERAIKDVEAKFKATKHLRDLPYGLDNPFKADDP